MAKRKWFTVEILFTAGAEVKRYLFKNCDHERVKALRSSLFREGIQLIEALEDNIFPVEYVVILPWNVKDFRIYLQDKPYYNEHSGPQQTVFSLEQNAKQ